MRRARPVCSFSPEQPVGAPTWLKNINLREQTTGVRVGAGRVESLQELLDLRHARVDDEGLRRALRLEDER